jgi:CBS domain containing-hemolysin-like protein
MLVGMSGLKPASEHELAHSEEELRLIIAESEEGGAIEPAERELIQNVFDFDDRIVRQVMVPRVKIIGIPLEANAEELAEILRTSQHTRYPIYDGDLDHIVGMVHIKDILKVIFRNELALPRRPHQLPLVPETMTLEAVLNAMHHAHTQMVVVMDEYGGTAGLITIEDVFEEVIGEVDEKAASHPEIRTDINGVFWVAGTVRIEELGERLNRALEHEEVDSVSGLVLALLGRPPVKGDVVSYDSVRFEVTDIEGHGVKECKVTLADKK